MTVSDTSIHRQICEKTNLDDIPLQKVAFENFGSYSSFSSILGRLGRPVVLTFGVVDSSELTLGKVSALLGPRDLKIRTGEFSDPNLYLEDRKYITKSFDEYMRELRTNPATAGYLGNFQLTIAESKELLHRQLHSIVNEKIVANTSLWFGPTGAITPLHKDSSDNFAFHLFGKKRWKIFSPRHVRNLKMERVDIPGRPDAEFATSRLDLRNSTVLEHLKNEKICWYEIEVGAGEILYVPTGWPHFVETIKESLMVSAWLKEGEGLSPLVLAS